MILYASATGDGRAVGCDECPNVIEAGDRVDDPGPWNDAHALSAAERHGWWVDADGRVVCTDCLQRGAA